MVLAMTLYVILGAVLIAFALMEKKNKHNVSYTIAGTIGVAILAIALLTSTGITDSLSVGGPAPADQAPDQAVIALSAGACDANGENCVVKPYTKVVALVKEWKSGSFTSMGGTVHIFDAGDDPRDTTVNARDTITVTSGTGNTTAGVLFSGTQYVILLDGTTTHYDMYYNAQAYPLTSMLPYSATTSDAISTQTIEFKDVVAFSTISDTIDESAVTGIINGQTNVSGLVGNSNELQVGADDSAANGDTIFYNKTNGDDEFYLDITISTTGSNTALINPVIDIVNDITNPFDGDEFANVKASKQSGDDLGIPNDVTRNFNEFAAIPLGSFLENGASAVYRFTFSVEPTNLAVGGDQLNIFFDDNGEYQGQDIYRGTKATPSSAITIAVRT